MLRRFSHGLKHTSGQSTRSVTLLLGMSNGSVRQASTGRARYHRRFARFKAIDARSKPVLFVRVAVCSDELALAPELLGELQGRFGKQTHLLVVINFQEKTNGPAFIKGSPNLLLFYLTSEVHRKESTSFGQPYVEPVKCRP